MAEADLEQEAEVDEVGLAKEAIRKALQYNRQRFNRRQEPLWHFAHYLSGQAPFFGLNTREKMRLLQEAIRPELEWNDLFPLETNRDPEADLARIFSGIQSPRGRSEPEIAHQFALHARVTPYPNEAQGYSERYVLYLSTCAFVQLAVGDTPFRQNNTVWAEILGGVSSTITNYRRCAEQWGHIQVVELGKKGYTNRLRFNTANYPTLKPNTDPFRHLAHHPPANPPPNPLFKSTVKVPKITQEEPDLGY